MYSLISGFMRQDHVNENLTNKRVSIIIQNISFRAKIRPTFSDTHRLHVTPLNILKCYYRPTASLQLNNKRNTKYNITVT